MVAESIITGLLDGFELAVRAGVAVIGFLLIIRSVISTVLPSFYRIDLIPFFRYTEVFVRPVRRILPSSVRTGKVDYSPLVSAVILLFLGLGISVFFEGIAHIVLD